MLDVNEHLRIANGTPLQDYLARGPLWIREPLETYVVHLPRRSSAFCK